MIRRIRNVELTDRHVLAETEVQVSLHSHIKGVETTFVIERVSRYHIPDVTWSSSHVKFEMIGTVEYNIKQELIEYTDWHLGEPDKDYEILKKYKLEATPNTKHHLLLERFLYENKREEIAEVFGIDTKELIFNLNEHNNDFYFKKVFQEAEDRLMKKYGSIQNVILGREKGE